ncbi:restriction endonuclease subunit S [Helicobacter bilis]|uniref:restriction endonuclease subunit S n=1 Tax=Helicobacter bilis TaxID=37372 RepID=UPI000AE7B167|nr:restriction endonuclease subunit S [Helicobacter bilis]
MRKEIFLNDNTESNKDTLLMQVMTEDLNTLLESLPTPPKEGWEFKKLGELGKVCMCKRIMKHETNDKEGIPFYKIGTFGAKADCYISQETYENYKANYSYPKNGQILISAAGTIGKAVIYNGEPAYFQDSNIVWIDTDEKIVSNRFLFYTYQNIDWQSKSTRGGTILRLYNDNLRAIQIPLPPLEAQEKIISAIESVENKITLFKEQSQTFEDRKMQVLKNFLVTGSAV